MRVRARVLVRPASLVLMVALLLVEVVLQLLLSLSDAPNVGPVLVLAG